MAGSVGTYPQATIRWRDGNFYPGRSLERVRPDGTIFTEVRFGMIKVRKYMHPDDIAPMGGDWICLKCGRINGKNYSNCNGCGGGKS